MSDESRIPAHSHQETSKLSADVTHHKVPVAVTHPDDPAKTTAQGQTAAAAQQQDKPHDKPLDKTAMTGAHPGEKDETTTSKQTTTTGMEMPAQERQISGLLKEGTGAPNEVGTGHLLSTEQIPLLHKVHDEAAVTKQCGHEHTLAECAECTTYTTKAGKAQDRYENKAQEMKLP